MAGCSLVDMLMNASEFFHIVEQWLKLLPWKRRLNFGPYDTVEAKIAKKHSQETDLHAELRLLHGVGLYPFSVA